MIGIPDIKKEEKEEEVVEDSKGEMILGPKKIWKDLEKEMAIRVNRKKEIIGGIEVDIEMEDIEVKEEIEGVIEEIVDKEEIEGIGGKIVGEMIVGKDEVTGVIEVKEEIDTIEETAKIVIIDVEITISRIVKKKKSNIHNVYSELNAHRRNRLLLKTNPVIIEQL